MMLNLTEQELILLENALTQAVIRGQDQPDSFSGQHLDEYRALHMGLTLAVKSNPASAEHVHFNYTGWLCPDCGWTYRAWASPET